ncbi:MAG: 3' terminal RNA ribose 2'-O-methyltransferase Hen1 [Planctomycetota bacterium]
MLLQISTTHEPATDLGYLLHKNPGRPQAKGLSFGTAHVFYTDASPRKCTATLMLEIDPVSLRRRGPGLSLAEYVSDRPYAASSFLSVAIAQVYGTALSGTCKQRPELVETSIPLTTTVGPVPCRGGEGFLRDLFEPLGYVVDTLQHPLDEQFPEWGGGTYFTVTLTQTIRLADLLSHLYVLLPVLDADKHYFVGSDEVDKLLRHGEGWLAEHTQKPAIARRYLKKRQSLVAEALRRLAVDEPDDPDAQELAIEKPISLHEQRLDAVTHALIDAGAERVVDLGCGEGRLLRRLLDERSVQQVVGVDVSSRSLEFAERRLKLGRMPVVKRQRIALLHGSLTYRDRRLETDPPFDAACLVEVIEHLDPPRLTALRRVVFEFVRPTRVILTTPNREYNVHWETLPAGQMRHRDHRFEWDRAEFAAWCDAAAEAFGYVVTYAPIGDDHPDTGPPTQMAIFTREAS